MHIIGGKRKKLVIEPDFLLKPVTRENRANLPPRVKVVFYLALKESPVPRHIVDDCMKHHPEYFEKKLKPV